MKRLLIAIACFAAPIGASRLSREETYRKRIKDRPGQWKRRNLEKRQARAQEMRDRRDRMQVGRERLALLSSELMEIE